MKKKIKKEKEKEIFEKKIDKKKVKKVKKIPEKKEKEIKIIKNPIFEKQGKKEIYLSVVIPAYNEATRLPMTLVDVDKKLLEMNLPSYEILVVDDGSKDATADIVERFKPLVKNLRLITNSENHGKGFVVRQGMLEAKGEIRIFMDADNSTTIDQFLKMKPFFDEGAQIVIGSRTVKGAELDPPQPFLKRIMGKAGNLFIQLVAVSGIWDTQCGFKAFKRTAAEDIFSRTTIDRWAFDIEALALARRLGYEIKEVPVYWKNDINSHVKLSSYFQVLLETVKIAYRIRKKSGEKRVEDDRFKIEGE
ncbi:MAG: glycosyltransferase family 2 protein [Candidatus Pacebacteria bacterium]|nr:glycosyltransferase family 2 protein [Candidatus Paceibacterota bacterium]